MKKSLSLLLALAMVFSMFASVAFAADDSASQTTLDKFNALKDAGIFAGVNDAGDPGLDQTMTRAQAAVVVSKLFNLDISNPPATATFSDVPASHWAYAYVEAAVTAGIIHGVSATTFNDKSNVTTQDLAVMLVLGFEKTQGLTVDPDATVDGSVSAYAQQYVAAAIANNLIPAADSYQQAALRSALVDASYSSYVMVQSQVTPGNVSVTAAKAAGVQKVEVDLNKAVDDTKATLALTKGSVSVATTTAWSDDKKSATLTLTDTKITAGDYKVTLGGVDASTIDNATASFTAEDETVQKIDFVSAGDTIAQSQFANVELKATNQYGEATSKGASSFSAFVMGTQVSPTKNSDGNLVVKFDTTTGGGFVPGTPTPGATQIPIIVYYNDNRVTAQKTFTLGNAPFLSKAELGDVTYSNGEKALKNAGDTASIAAKFFDQYGNQIVAGQIGSDLTSEIKQNTINAMTNPYNQHLTFDNTVRNNIVDINDNTQILLTLDQKQDKSADYTVTVYAGTASATATVSVSAAKIANVVDFGSFTDTVAAGDTNVYIPLVATDANGDQMSAQDLVDSYNDDPSRFSFTATNTTVPPTLVATGDKKGKLKLQLDSSLSARSTVYVTAMVNSINTNSYKQFSFQVQEQRHPDHIKVVTEPAAKGILDATTKVKYELDDQYGSKFKGSAGTPAATNYTDANGQTAQYQVVLTLSGDAATSGISLQDEASPTPNIVLDNGHTTKAFGPTDYDALNSEMKFHLTAGKTGTVTVKAIVQKNTGSSWSDFSGTVSRSVEAIDPGTSLTYSMGDLGTHYAVIDKSALLQDTVSADTYTPKDSFFSKKVSISAKDSAGNSVALPNNAVRGIRTSDPNVTSVDQNGNDGYVLGNKAGTATVTAVVYTNKGNTITLSKDITIKDETIAVDHITVDNSTVAFVAQANVFDLVNDIHVFDQYGDEFKGTVDNGAKITEYAKALGLTYTTKVTSGSGSVNINAVTGDITSVASSVHEFVLTITAPNGKSIDVTVTH